MLTPKLKFKANHLHREKNSLKRVCNNYFSWQREDRSNK